MKRISIKKMAVLLFCMALLTGCGPKSEVSLPDDFPMDLEFSSGVGGWGTSLTLERDGTFSGQFHDSWEPLVRTIQTERSISAIFPDGFRTLKKWTNTAIP